MLKFKVGDSVRVILGRSTASKIYQNSTAIITTATNSLENYYGLDIEEDGMSSGVWESELELIEESEEENMALKSETTTASGLTIPAPQIKIEIDDIVMIKPSNIGMFGDYRQEEAIVYSITPGADLPIMIRYKSDNQTSSVKAEYLLLVSKASTLPPENNPINIDALTLLCEIYVQNESTNEKILALFQKIVDNKKDGEKEDSKDAEDGESDPKEKPQESKDGQKQGTEKSGKPEEKQSQKEQDSEKSQSEEASGESLTPKKKSKKSTKPGTEGTDEFEIDDSEKSEAMELIQLILKGAADKQPGADGKMHAAINAIKDEQDSLVGGGSGRVERIAVEKVWCGVCRKEHTKGTHD